jgi:HEAT repeat protein
MNRMRGGAVAVGAAAAALGLVVALGAVRGEAREAGDGWTPHPTQEAAGARDAAGLLAAVAGTPPVACDLVVRTLGNRWGRGMVHPRVHEPLGPTADQRALARWAWTEEPAVGAAPRLLEALGSADACVRRVAAAMLQRIEDDATREALRNRAERGTGPERLAAITALAGRREAASERTLQGLLGEPDPVVRRAAAWALGEMEAAGAVAALGRLLRDPDTSVRENAAWALGRIERAEGVALLSGALRDGSPAVRVNAAWALGAIESPQAIPLLSSVLASDADAEVRMAAAWALGRIED